MQDRELYATILGISAPWLVERVELRADDQEVEVFLGRDGTPMRCAVCDEVAPGYDARRRSWRHLDTVQYRTTLTADVPRTKCSKHGVHRVQVPWAEAGGRFTALFERLAIDWLREASLSAVSRRLRVTWDELDGIMSRAVARGLARRKREEVTELGIDETSFQKHHEYVTVISDLTKGRVLEVADDRGEGALVDFYSKLDAKQLSAIRAVAMDMWKPFIKTTRAFVPDADTKICFDRFHVASYFNDAINAVRKQEHRELLARGDHRLARTRFLWMMSPARLQKLSQQRRDEFKGLRHTSLKVGRAWVIKEAARTMWHYKLRGWATRGWRIIIGWARRSRLPPMVDLARMLEEHLWGIVNAAVLHVTNAGSESLNAKIQWLKKAACGFRNRARFRNAILFHCGQLDLYPALSAHSNP